MSAEVCDQTAESVYTHRHGKPKNQLRSGHMRTQESGNRGLSVILRSFALGVALLIVGAAWFAINAAPKPKPAADADKDKATVDHLQRSLLLDTYRIDGDSGAARGEVIYAYKCWMCHNKYTKGGPYLQDLYHRQKLVSGEPVTDESVSAKIKRGGPGMPAYRNTLSDADIADLRAYFHSEKCCVEGENPPANPWYRAQTNKWPVQSGL